MTPTGPSAVIGTRPTRPRFARSPTDGQVTVTHDLLARSAHGQEMISTATAFTSAHANLGSGPTQAQTPNVTKEMAMTSVTTISGG